MYAALASLQLSYCLSEEPHHHRHCTVLQGASAITQIAIYVAELRFCSDNSAAVFFLVSNLSLLSYPVYD